MNIWNEIKSMSPGQIALIPVFTVILTTLATIYINKSQTPSALIGWIEEPPGTVLVNRDNAAAVQYADDITGWFRFEDVSRGRHQLRFEFDQYHPLPVTVNVSAPGDNYLEELVTLTPLAATKTPPAPLNVMTTFIPKFTKDGSPPSIALDRLRFVELLKTHSAAERYGWFYLGSANNRAAAFAGLVFGQNAQISGQSIESEVPVLIWDGAPEKQFFRGFRLGMIEGVADAGVTFTFSDDVVVVRDGRVWARAKINDTS